MTVDGEEGEPVPVVLWGQRVPVDRRMGRGKRSEPKPVKAKRRLGPRYPAGYPRPVPMAPIAPMVKSRQPVPSEPGIWRNLSTGSAQPRWVREDET